MPCRHGVWGGKRPRPTRNKALEDAQTRGKICVQALPEAYYHYYYFYYYYYHYYYHHHYYYYYNYYYYYYYYCYY